MQVVLWVMPPITGVPAQIGVLLGGIVLVALASGLYIGARFGPGPRDGLMTGLNSRLGWPIWACRALVEVTRARIGWVLGGTVGIGTVLFAVLIGPLVHVALPVLDTAAAQGRRRGAPSARGRRRARLTLSVLAELRPIAAGRHQRVQGALGDLHRRIACPQMHRRRPS